MSAEDLGPNQVFGLWIMVTGPLSMYFNVSGSSIESFILGLPVAFVSIFCLAMISEVEG